MLRTMRITASSGGLPLRQTLRALAGGLLLAMSTLSLAAVDVSGSKVHPLLSRFTGATIGSYSYSQFDEALLPNQPIATESRAKTLTLEGQVTRIGYIISGDKSTLEVERN